MPTRQEKTRTQNQIYRASAMTANDTSDILRLALHFFICVLLLRLCLIHKNSSDSFRHTRDQFVPYAVSTAGHLICG